MLHSALRPDEYKTMMTYFGFLLHPLFKLVDYDLTSYRRAWVVIYSAITLLFSVSMLRFLSKTLSLNLSSKEKTLFFLSIFSSCLYYFSYYTGLTANYNTVAFAGVMLLFTGLAGITTSYPNTIGRLSPLALFGLTLLACIGLFITTLSKVTTGILIGPVVLLWLWVFVDQPRQRGRLILTSVIILIILFYSFILGFSGGLIHFIEDIKVAIQISSSHHNLGLLINKFVSDISQLLFWYPDKSVFKWLFSNSIISRIAVCSLLLLIIFQCFSKPISVTIIALLAIDAMRALIDQIILKVGIFKWINIVSWSVQIWLPWIVFAIIFTLLIRTFNDKVIDVKNSNKISLTIFMFLLVPFCVYFGSGSRSFAALSGAMVFYVIGFYLFVYRASISTNLKNLTLTLSTIIICVSLVVSSWAHTTVVWHMRYLDANTPVTIGNSAHQIKSTSARAAYYINFKNFLYDNGFTPDSAVISPKETIVTQSAVYLAAGKPLGNPIFYDFAHLTTVPKSQIECAWVILNEIVSETIIKSFSDIGIDYKSTYQFIGIIDSQYHQQNNLYVYSPQESTNC